MVHLHPLRFKIFPKMQRSGTLDDCFLFRKCLVVKVIESLDRRFTYILVFNANKISSSKYYYEKVNDIYCQTKRWLKRSCKIFGVGESPIVGTAKCLGEMDEFIYTISKSCRKSISVEHGIYEKMNLNYLKAFHIWCNCGKLFLLSQ